MQMRPLNLLSQIHGTVADICIYLSPYSYLNNVSEVNICLKCDTGVTK